MSETGLRPFAHPPRFAAGVAACALACWLSIHTLPAASQDRPALQRPAEPSRELSFPGVGRVVFGFTLTVALAVGAAYLLRRTWPAFLSRQTSSDNIRRLGRSAVSTTLTVHLIEVDGTRVVVAESRSGVGLTVLPQGPGPGTGKSDL